MIMYRRKKALLISDVNASRTKIKTRRSLKIVANLKVDDAKFRLY